jgi:hypothetical protein
MTFAFKKMLFATAFVIAGAPAFAVVTPTVFDFASLKGNNVNFGLKPTDGINCTGADLCSSNVNGNVLNGDLTFVKNGLTVLASASYNGSASGTHAAVVQDAESRYNGLLSGPTAIGAGLGVYHSNNNSDDNITTGESLKLSFDHVVNLSSVGLRSDGHNTTSWINQATFQYSFDNTLWVTALLPKNSGQFSLAHTGKDFYFRFGGGSKADQFYLSSMTVTAVPEPETFALLLAGLGLVGAVVRRRKAQTA